jgi:hypothetical protein
MTKDATQNYKTKSECEEGDKLVSVVRCKDCTKGIQLTDAVLCLQFGEHYMSKEDYCSSGLRCDQ